MGGVRVRERSTGELVPELSLSVCPLDFEADCSESCHMGRLLGWWGLETGLHSTLLLFPFNRRILAANSSPDTGCCVNKQKNFEISFV